MKINAVKILSKPKATDLVFGNDVFSQRLVEHSPVPVDETLWLWYFLFGWMTMEDVVVALTRWTSPDMGICIARKEKPYQ